MKRFVVTVFAVFVAVMITSGCGTIHIGETTHTHFYGTQNMASDDATDSIIAKYIKFVKTTLMEEAESLDNFRWIESKENDNDDMSDDRTIRRE